MYGLRTSLWPQDRPPLTLLVALREKGIASVGCIRLLEWHEMIYALTNNSASLVYYDHGAEFFRLREELTTYRLV